MLRHGNCEKSAEEGIFPERVSKVGGGWVVKDFKGEQELLVYNVILCRTPVKLGGYPSSG